MKTLTILTLLTLMTTGCATVVNIPEPEEPKIVKNTNKEFNTLQPPAGGQIIAAVYGFQDKTGQRKPSDKLANISFAVTQGADAWVVKALQDVGNGKWFKVVERVGLDSLTKERQIIRQARESVNDQRQLKPMMFAGIMVEGGIIGYDSNTLTGGAGARYLGIGPSTSYRHDVVTITMRAVSVQTGEILVSVSVTKSIISSGSSLTIFKFFDQGTKSFESEFGYTVNEPVNYAVRSAIEQAVVELVKEGADKRHWAFKTEPQPVEAEVAVVPPAPVVLPVIKPDEVVEVVKVPEVQEPVKDVIVSTPKEAEIKVVEKPVVITEKVSVAEQPKRFATIKHSTFIRKQADTMSAILLPVEADKQVTVLEITKYGWIQIEYNGVVGWVFKEFIR